MQKLLHNTFSDYVCFNYKASLPQTFHVYSSKYVYNHVVYAHNMQYMYLCMHVCMHVGMYVCMYAYMYVCMYVCTVTHRLLTT